MLMWEKSLGPQSGERSGLSSYVNVSFKPREGMFEGESIISWLHNVCVLVTPYFSHLEKNKLQMHPMSL
jgi:hypothetical protein